MLTYTGGGYGGFLSGVPARDLTDAEAAAHGGADALMASGLYEMSTDIVAADAARTVPTRRPGRRTTEGAND